MAKKNLWTEKNKKLFLVALFVVLGIVVVYELNSPSPKPKASASSGAAPAASVPPPSGPVVQPSSSTGSDNPAAAPSPAAARPRDSEAARQEELQVLLADTSPLNFAVLTVDKGGAEVKRNVFAYYVPPPPPPAAPPKPPPIALRYVQPQTVVAGTPKPVVLIVSGAPLPPDAQVIFGGAPRPTRRTGEGGLAIDVTPADYASPRNVPIEIKSQSNPAGMYSNQIAFMVQPSPAPPFKFVGRIGELAVFELSEGGAKEYMRLARSATIQGVWRIDVIGDNYVEVTDTRYDIKKRVPLEEKR
jgi:hypothetical protein